MTDYLSVTAISLDHPCPAQNNVRTWVFASTSTYCTWMITWKMVAWSDWTSDSDLTPAHPFSQFYWRRCVWILDGNSPSWANDVQHTRWLKSSQEPIKEQFHNDSWFTSHKFFGWSDLVKTALQSELKDASHLHGWMDEWVYHSILLMHLIHSYQTAACGGGGRR